MSREELRIPVSSKEVSVQLLPLCPYHVTAGSLINPKYPLSVGAMLLHLCLWERHAAAPLSAVGAYRCTSVCGERHAAAPLSVGAPTPLH